MRSKVIHIAKFSQVLERAIRISPFRIYLEFFSTATTPQSSNNDNEQPLRSKVAGFNFSLTFSSGNSPYKTKDEQRERKEEGPVS